MYLSLKGIIEQKPNFHNCRNVGSTVFAPDYCTRRNVSVQKKLIPTGQHSSLKNKVFCDRANSWAYGVAVFMLIFFFMEA